VGVTSGVLETSYLLVLVSFVFVSFSLLVLVSLVLVSLVLLSFSLDEVEYPVGVGVALDFTSLVLDS